jgi:WD40 repeat protein/DNA-directed RNA polymerase specialized sigma24 family protein
MEDPIDRSPGVSTGAASGSDDLVPEDHGEVETWMAFWLENVSPDDPQIHAILVERYGVEMCRLADYLLGNSTRRHAPAETLELASMGFDEAVASLATFRGAPSARSWLYAQLLRRSRDWRRYLRWPWAARGRASRLEGDGQDARPAGPESLQAGAFDDLPKRARLVLFLHFGLGLVVPEIAYVIGRRPDQVETTLSEARSQIHGALRETNAPDQDLEVWAPLALQARWPSPSPEVCAPLFARIDTGRQGKARLVPTGVGGNLREVLLVFIVLLAALVFGRFFMRLDVHRGRPLYPETPVPTPTAVPVAEVPVHEAPGVVIEETAIALRLDPALSADGRWLAYMQTDNSGNTDVFLFDRQEQASIQVNRAPDGSPAQGWSASPSISADGRWVVFFSDAEDLAAGNDLTCTWNDIEINCLNIFLFDRNHHELRAVTWITRAADGAPADGHSLMPAISADGNWVAFWSSASNLTPEDTQMCGSGEQAHNCWDVFLYNRQNGQIQRIPIGRRYELLESTRLFTLSLSEDGSTLALTIHATDQIAGQLGKNDYSQVWIYQRAESVWQRGSIDSSNRFGEGDSYLPQLSADGRFVAFISSADRLVPGDTNGKADVFVRDLGGKETEIVSISSRGDPGNDHSGILPGEFGMWGETPGISSDGRYVTYISSATNLALLEEDVCPRGQDTPCLQIYLHDRQTDETVSVINRPVEGELFFFPGISGDGGMVHYVDYQYDYCPGPYCADILLYDQRSGMTTMPLSVDTDLSQNFQGTWRNTNFIDTLSGGGVYSLAFSSNGDRIATGLSNGTIRVWSFPDGKLLYTLETHTGLLENLAYSPDGALMASASQDSTVGLWSAADGALLRRLPSEGGSVLDLAFSPDGQVLYLGSQRAAWSWDLRDLVFSLLNYIEYHGEHSLALAVSPDGALLAHGLSDGSLWLRHASNLEVIARVDAHAEAINCLAFSPDGAYLASGGKDHQAQLWRLEQQGGSSWSIERVKVWAHADWVNDLAFSPDGRWLAVAAFRSDIQLWGIPGSAGQDLALQAGNFQPLSVDFSPDGSWLAVGSSWGGMRIWRAPAP